MLLLAQPGRSTILSAYVDTADHLHLFTLRFYLLHVLCVCFKKNVGTMHCYADFESSTKIRVNTRCQALCVVWSLFRVWFFGIMIQKLPFCLIIVLFSHLQVVISKSDLHARTSLNISPNGSTFLWLPQDEYSGPSFFECVHFLFRHVKHLRITRKPLGLFHGR